MPVVVTPEFLSEIFAGVTSDPSLTLTVDLETQTITNNATAATESFDINPYKRECLLKGMDDIDYLLSKKQLVLEYESNRT